MWNRSGFFPWHSPHTFGDTVWLETQLLLKIPPLETPPSCISHSSLFPILWVSLPPPLPVYIIGYAYEECWPCIMLQSGSQLNNTSWILHGKLADGVSGIPARGRNGSSQKKKKKTAHKPVDFVFRTPSSVLWLWWKGPLSSSGAGPLFQRLDQCCVIAQCLYFLDKLPGRLTRREKPDSVFTPHREQHWCYVIRAGPEIWVLQLF